MKSDTSTNIFGNFVRVTLRVTVQENDNWSSITGNAEIDVLLPISAVGALDIGKALPALITHADNELAEKMAQDALAKAKEREAHAE